MPARTTGFLKQWRGDKRTTLMYLEIIEGLLVLLLGGSTFFYYKKYSTLIKNKYKCSICGLTRIEDRPLTESQLATAKDLTLDKIRSKTFESDKNVFHFDLNPKDIQPIPPVVKKKPRKRKK